VRPTLVMLRISAFGRQVRIARVRVRRIAAAVGGLSYLSGYPTVRRSRRDADRPGLPRGVFGALGRSWRSVTRSARAKGSGGPRLYEPVLRILDDAIPVYGASGPCASASAPAPRGGAHNHYRSRDGGG